MTVTTTELDVRRALAPQQQEFRALVRVVDPGTVVPGCPGWTAADLVAHLTGVHRWAAAMVRTAPGASTTGSAHHGEPAADPEAGYAAAAAALLDVLDADPARPCLTLAGAGTAADWARRQLHETLVHTWDLADAAGLPRWAAPEVVADAVSEVLDTLLPRQVRLGRTPPPEVAVDLLGSRRWRLGPGPVVATVAGPDAEILRLLWRRSWAATGDGGELVIGGDVAAAAQLLGGRLTP